MDQKLKELEDNFFTELKHFKNHFDIEMKRLNDFFNSKLNELKNNPKQEWENEMELFSINDLGDIEKNYYHPNVARHQQLIANHNAFHTHKECAKEAEIQKVWKELRAFARKENNKHPEATGYSTIYSVRAKSKKVHEKIWNHLVLEEM